MRLFEPLVQHACQSRHLVRVALDRVGQLFLGVSAEMVPLAEHRPDPAHLEHDPFQAFVAADRVFRNQLAAGLFGQIDQDCRRLEQRERLAARPVGIDDRRDPVVGRDLEEFRLELVAGSDIDCDDLVREAQLLQRDMHLVAVRRCPGP